MTSLPSRISGALALHYRLEREIGAGGMATVYLAEDLRARPQGRPQGAAARARRGDRRRAVPRRDQDSRPICSIRTSCRCSIRARPTGCSIYVMPFVEGESLRDRLDREKQLPIDDAVRIAREVADALDYAHRHGVIHRDIKPENILLHDGRALVADFGIALAASKAGGTRMTETGMSLGTPQYMTPGAGDGRARASRRAPTSTRSARAVRDAHRRAAVHREHRAGDRRASADRDPPPLVCTARTRSRRTSRRRC